MIPNHRGALTSSAAGAAVEAQTGVCAAWQSFEASMKRGGIVPSDSAQAFLESENHPDGDPAQSSRHENL
jgi:hypothetical protein